MGQALVLAGQTITPAILNRIYGTGDTTQHTSNTASFTDLSTVFSIPASDAQAGTAYRLACFGNGTWASSGPQALTFGTELASTVIGTQPQIAAGAFSTSAAFDFWVESLVICVSPGSSATWVSRITGNLSETANALAPGTAADNTVNFTGCTHSAVTQDSTVASNLIIVAKWASTTGTPTLTSVGTLFEKVN